MQLCARASAQRAALRMQPTAKEHAAWRLCLRAACSPAHAIGSYGAVPHSAEGRVSAHVLQLASHICTLRTRGNQWACAPWSTA